MDTAELSTTITGHLKPLTRGRVGRASSKTVTDVTRALALTAGQHADQATGDLLAELAEKGRELDLAVEARDAAKQNTAQLLEGMAESERDRIAARREAAAAVAKRHQMADQLRTVTEDRDNWANIAGDRLIALQQAEVQIAGLEAAAEKLVERLAFRGASSWAEDIARALTAAHQALAGVPVVPWDEVPEPLRRLTVAVAQQLLDAHVITVPGPAPNEIPDGCSCLWTVDNLDLARPNRMVRMHPDPACLAAHPVDLTAIAEAVEAGSAGPAETAGEAAG